MTADPIVIVAARRTPMGGFQGDFAGLTASQLGAAAIRAALADSGVDCAAVERGVMGCVLGAGQGQAPARQALLGAGLPQSCAAVTVNKMCGSGMQAAIDAHDALVAGSADIMVAGGMESMTNAPYLLAKARGGFRMGHGEIKDSMFLDGLEDAYEPGRLMGSFAEDTARDYQFTRQAQDAWAIRSTTRAQAAIAGGAFDAEVVGVPVKAGEVKIDEQPGKARLDKIPTLKPAFAKDGTVTAANASSISDGAAALILTRTSVAAAHGLTPLARILGHSVHAQAPSQFATAPAPAIRKLLEKPAERRRYRPVGGQRSFRRRGDGGGARPRPRCRARQHPRRRVRARPPDRRKRRAHSGHATPRAAAHRRHAWRRVAVHRRR